MTTRMLFLFNLTFVILVFFPSFLAAAAGVVAFAGIILAVALVFW